MPPVDELPSVDRTLLSIAESLLFRGTTPLPYPEIESRLGLDRTPQEGDYEPALRRLALAPTFPSSGGPFDSEEERILTHYIKKLCLDESLPWQTLSQVYLTSLTPDFPAGAQQRGDLLLLHPMRPPILVEVDGPQHAAHQAADAARDAALASAGITVVRIPTSEVRNHSGQAFMRLEELLRGGIEPVTREDSLTVRLRLLKVAHQLQVVVLKALESGHLPAAGPWRIHITPPIGFEFDSHAVEVFREALGLLSETLRRLARIYSLPENEPQVEVFTGNASVPTGSLTIAPASSDPGNTAFLISDLAYPGHLLAGVTPVTPRNATNPEPEDLRWFLRYIFRKPDFLEGQSETISRLLQGLDTLVLLPTGAGKSIAFQLAALLRPGRCIVVDPLIALIEDQIANLRAYGIDRVAGISSQQTFGERSDVLDAFQNGHFIFTFVAPERFQMREFRETLRSLTSAMPISLIAVDEAHCVSEWGHDFRTAYLNLGRITREYCQYFGEPAPLVGLTGTASRIVLKDVQRELDIGDFDAMITPDSFDRSELHFTITSCQSAEKQARLNGLLNRLPGEFGQVPATFFVPNGDQTNAGLIFCPHINGGYGTVAQAEFITRSLGVSVATYSSVAPNRVATSVWNEQRRIAASDFKKNKVSILACTKAFGMGIDKSNIRYTIHIGIPQSIEAFYQEAGRAGRDRAKAVCSVIISDDQPDRSMTLLSPNTSLEVIEAAVNNTSYSESDDVIRALFFHVKSFSGRKRDADDIAVLLTLLGDLSSQRTVSVTWRDDAWGLRGQQKGRAEKAMHRLVVLGIVRDYSVDYSAGEFTAHLAGADRQMVTDNLSTYVRAYQTRLGEAMRARCDAVSSRSTLIEFATRAGQFLVDFIYEHIELARRQSLREMFLAAKAAADRADGGERLRNHILEYLQQTEWDQPLDEIRQDSTASLKRFEDVLEAVVTPTDAAALRGASNRQLASYPDVPLLLLLRAASEAMASDSDPKVVEENIKAGVSFGFGTFGYPKAAMARAVALIAAKVQSKSQPAEVVRAAVRADSTDREWLRDLVASVPDQSADAAKSALLSLLVSRIDPLLERTRHAQ